MMRACILLLILVCPTQAMRPVAQKTINCELHGEGTKWRDYCGKQFGPEYGATEATSTSAAELCQGRRCVCPNSDGKKLELKEFVRTQTCGASAKINWGGCADGCAVLNEHFQQKYNGQDITAGIINRLMHEPNNKNNDEW